MNKSDQTLQLVYGCTGGGTTFESSAKEAIKGMSGYITPVAMIASKPSIGAIEKAEKLGIPKEVLINPKDPDEILRILEKYKADIFSLNGYLPILPREVIEKFLAKGGILLNQHPAILRSNGLDFGGAEKGMGMYGARPTAARILQLITMSAQGNDIFTESTVQKVDPEVDRGLSVGVIQLPFSEELDAFRDEKGIGPDDLEKIDYKNLEDPIVMAIKEFTQKIQAKLLLLEHENVANVLGRIGTGELNLKEAPGYEVPLFTAGDKETLDKAKRRSVLLFPKG